MLAKFGWIKGSGIKKNKQVTPTGNIDIVLFLKYIILVNLNIENIIPPKYLVLLSI